MDNKAVQLTSFDVGNPTSTMIVAQTARPTPGPGEVLVRMTLRPCNPADIFSIMGVYPGFQPGGKFPAVPGLEGVGVVEACGPGATKFAPGQRVVGCPFNTVEHGCGTWQQFLVAAEGCLAAVPATVSDEAAAQFWVNPVTVFGMLQVLAVPAGECLLQTAAGSVLGRQLIQLAKHRGIKTINVVRRAELADELRALGADEVVVSVGGEGLADRVKEITGGKGAYAAVECIGGDIFAQVAASVRNSGTVLIYGAMSGLTATYSIPDPLFRDVAIRGFWLITWSNGLPSGEKERACQEVLQLLADGVITPYAGKRFPLDSVVEAIGEATSAARGGKVLLEG